MNRKLAVTYATGLLFLRRFTRKQFLFLKLQIFILLALVLKLLRDLKVFPLFVIQSHILLIELVSLQNALVVVVLLLLCIFG